MISKETIQKILDHRDCLINSFLEEFTEDIACLDGSCTHKKICKSGCYIKLNEEKQIVDLEYLEDDKMIDACIYSTILSTFINDIKLFRELKHKIQEQEILDELNKKEE